MKNTTQTPAAKRPAKRAVVTANTQKQEVTRPLPSAPTSQISAQKQALPVATAAPAYTRRKQVAPETRNEQLAAGIIASGRQRFHNRTKKNNSAKKGLVKHSPRSLN